MSDADKAAARWVLDSCEAGYALPMSEAIRAKLDDWQGSFMRGESTLTLMMGGVVERGRDYLEARAREVLGDE